MNLIELKKVNKSFKIGDQQVPVLRNVSFSIKKGEFVAIVGPSGSGKSTLMNIIGLLDTPTSGEYLLEGDAVASQKDKQLAQIRRERIGFVFQSFNLLPRLSLLQNVELPMIYGRQKASARRERATQLLEQVGLKERAKQSPTKVSGGELQRAAIARALANHPSLILADEPTGNLDSTNSDRVMKTLWELHKAGATIVVITHNPEIASLAQRVLKMRDGRLAEARR